MSNSVSTAQQGKRHVQTHPDVPAPNQRQLAFGNATQDMLDESRQVVEGAVGQGQELNPLIYQMLGLDPQYKDNTADLKSSQDSLDAATKAYDTAKQTLSQLQGIPAGKRTKQQRKQFRQLKAHMPALQNGVNTATSAHGKMMTQPKTITGLSRLDPSKIPADSPFSALNPLNQLQSEEAKRALQYTRAGSTDAGTGGTPGTPGAGGAAGIDPTLVHSYNAAESSLRAKLAQRFGPDYESTSVGQMALQNFGRQKNEAFATWNQQQQEKYSNEAFQQSHALNSLLAEKIGLMRNPEQSQIGEAGAVANVAGARIPQEQLINQMLLGRGGVTTNVTSPLALASGVAGGAADLAKWAFSPSGTGQPSPASQAWTGIKGAASDIANWASGSPGLVNAGGSAGGAAGASDMGGAGVTAGGGAAATDFSSSAAADFAA